MFGLYHAETECKLYKLLEIRLELLRYGVGENWRVFSHSVRYCTYMLLFLHRTVTKRNLVHFLRRLDALDIRTHGTNIRCDVECFSSRVTV